MVNQHDVILVASTAIATLGFAIASSFLCSKCSRCSSAVSKKSATEPVAATASASAPSASDHRVSSPSTSTATSNAANSKLPMERTFIALKPDAMERGMIGETIRMLEKKGFRLVALKMLNVSSELASSHYAEHADKPFYDSLIEFITSSPVIAIVIEGSNAVRLVRKMVGETKPSTSAAGSIRGARAVDVGRNVIHASDSVESSQREIALWFQDEELTQYDICTARWIYEKL